MIPQPALCLLILLALTGPAQARAGGTFPGDAWAVSPSPEAAGWSDEALRAADAFASTLSTDACLVVHAGVIVHEYGDTRTPRNLHSMRKSILSILMGMAVDKGEVSLDRTMEDLAIDDLTRLSAAERQATVRQLLQARSGVYLPAAYETREMKDSRPARGGFAPGEHWYYNNWDFNALGTIYARCTGKTVFQALASDLAQPLRFENFRPEADIRFIHEPESMHPAYTMRLSARDLARIGLLMARKGVWQGRRLVSGTWVAESTTAWSTDHGGYGYLWWVGVEGRLFGAQFPGKVFAARGHRGQYLLVDPERDLVIVHQVDTRQPGERAVSGRDFSRLLRLLLAACPR